MRLPIWKITVSGAILRLISYLKIKHFRRKATILRAKSTKMKAEMDAEIAFLRAKWTKMKAEMDAEIAFLRAK